MRAVVKRGEALFKPELNALLQALLGLFSKPSDGLQVCLCARALLWVVPPRSHQVLTCLRLLQQVECFGKKINHPQVLEVLFRTLPRSPLDVRHAAMKEMNVLFVRKEENYKIFMKQRAWQTWLVPLVASIPADKEVRVLRVASVCKSRAHTCLPVCVDAGRLAPRKRRST